MFCPRCNNPLEEQVAFCGVCGALLRPRLAGETMFEEPDSVSASSHAMISPTVFSAPPVSTRQPTMASPEPFFGQQSMHNMPAPSILSPVPPPPPRKERIPTSRLFIILALLILIVIVVGGWFLTRGIGAKPPSAQVSFLDSQNSVPGGTNALKITATGLPNPPDGSQYKAWLINTADEQILPLGALSKSDPNTFTLSFPGDGSFSKTNLLGVGNKIELTQEQGKVTTPTGKILLSATFPPRAFVHIRHLLFSFPTTPNKVGLLTGLLNETQKVDALSAMLRNTNGDQVAVGCIAQEIINVIEGSNGEHFRPLATKCARVEISDTMVGDGFGILGNGYIATATNHASLAASQADTTEAIRLTAKDVAASTANLKTVLTQINENALGLLANPATVSKVPEIVSLADRAYHGFDQDGDGKIEPIEGEAGALTAYTSGQRMALLSLS
jgi:hypothetical protein